MDITSVTSYRFATNRAELALAPGEVFLAGGTWLMSDPDPAITGFVDLSRIGWTPIEISPEGLRLAATCTISALVSWANGPDAPREWTALSIVEDAANALLASFKIWNTATVGGNLCRSFAAGSMISLTVALDGTAVIWEPGGGEKRLPVAELITGNGTNILAPGEVLRAVDIPAAALRSRAALRKIALAEHGRSGTVVTGRVDEDGRSVFTITAATLTPKVRRFAALPGSAELEAACLDAGGFYTDPLGTADWRRATSAVLANRVRRDLLGDGQLREAK